MDPKLTHLIDQIQKAKQDLYQRHKPQVIETLSESRVALRNTTTTEAPARHSSAYESLMKQQRKLVYRKDREAQQKSLDPTPEGTAQQEQIREQLASRINFHSAKEEANFNAELQKPWNKLSNSLKIRVILKFVDALTPYLTLQQVNQLRYLLISAVNERKLTKLSDIEYDSEKCQIIRIYRLVFEDQIFKLATQEAGDKAININTVNKDSFSSPVSLPIVSVPIVPKIKLILNKSIPKINS